MEDNRSTFISVLSWILILLSGFALFMISIQNILINTIFPKSEIEKVLKEVTSLENYGFLFSNLEIIFIVLEIFVVIAFISSFALLKRKNWARLALSVIFGFGIVYVLGAMVLEWSFMFRSATEYGTLLILIEVLNFVFFISFSALLVWLIKKLNSPEIIEEFNETHTSNMYELK